MLGVLAFIQLGVVTADELVGASGAIMGLVGATGAILLLGGCAKGPEQPGPSLCLCCCSWVAGDL